MRPPDEDLMHKNGVLKKGKVSRWEHLLATSTDRIEFFRYENRGEIKVVGL